MRAKKDSDYQEMLFGGRLRKKRKEGKGFFGNSQARFSDMAGAGDGIDMSKRGRGFLGIGGGKGSALRREKRQLKRALKRGGLNKEQSDRLSYLKNVQKDRAKKAIGAGALAAGAAFGGAALAGKLGAKGAAAGGKGLFKGGLKGIFKGGAKGAGKGAGKGGFKDMLKKEGKKFLNQQLQSIGQGGGAGQQPAPQYQPMPQVMPQSVPQAMPQATPQMLTQAMPGTPVGDESLQTVNMYGEDGMKVMKYRGGGLVGGQHKLDKNKDGEISGADFKMMGNGGTVKYRSGGMIYAEDSDLLQAEKEKNGTAGPSGLADLFSTLEAVEVPEDYTEQEFIDVRGTARMGDQEVEKAAGGALDRDVAQPLEFRVRKYGGRVPQLRDMEFELEDVQLGGVDEETGELIPNTITLPAYVFDAIEEGAIERKDIIQALGQSYSRSDERGRRAVPQILRGEDPEPREPGPPGRGKIKIKKKREFRLPQLPYLTSPKYEAGRRPLFTPGQLGRVGRGG